jgi:uncharacterized protein (TIGR02466 family)
MSMIADAATKDPRGIDPTTPVKAAVIPLFSTWVYLCEHGPKHLNVKLEELTRTLMSDDRNGTRRTNQGGWHFKFDVFELREPVVDEFREEMVEHLHAYLNQRRPPARKKRDRFRLQGWINVNCAGDRNVLHCHPGCFLSGTYYVRTPEAMKGGEIVFRDPRGPAVAMYETPDIELPWVGNGIGIPFSPETGHVVIFPAWLEHHVEPFTGAGDRISIAFNAVNP